MRVLEARQVGSGASGRNGGFALRGLASAYSARPNAELWRLTEEGVERLASLAEDTFRRVGVLSVVEDEEGLELGRRELAALAEEGFAAEWVEREALPPSSGPITSLGSSTRPQGCSIPGAGRGASPSLPRGPAPRSQRTRGRSRWRGQRLELTQARSRPKPSCSRPTATHAGLSPSSTSSSPRGETRCWRRRRSAPRPVQSGKVSGASRARVNSSSSMLRPVTTRTSGSPTSSSCGTAASAAAAAPSTRSPASA